MLFHWFIDVQWFILLTLNLKLFDLVVVVARRNRRLRIPIPMVVARE